MQEPVAAAIKIARDESRTTLLENESKQLCASYGIQTPTLRLATSPNDAARAAEGIGFPVALKVISPDISHKTDADCVRLGLCNATEVKHAYDEICANAKRYNPNVDLRGVLVEKLQPKGIEVIVGGLRDPQFGPAVMFGLGGILVELFADFSFRVAPLTDSSVRRMISEVKGYEILKGYRGREPIDQDSLVKVILASSKLLVDHPEISEMDLNPVILYPRGAVAVDVRMRLAS
jgi:acyl-CoA synthetase (NDP forming)